VKGFGDDPAGVARQCTITGDLSDGNAAGMGERPVAAAGAAGSAYGGPGDGLLNDTHSDDDSGSGSSHGGEGNKSKAGEGDAVIQAATHQGMGESSKKGKHLKRARGGKENGQGGKAAPKGPPKRQKKAGRYT